MVDPAQETEEGHELSSIKVRRRKLNCFNGCINRRTKYSVVVKIQFCAFSFYFIVEVCHFSAKHMNLFLKNWQTVPLRRRASWRLQNTLLGSPQVREEVPIQSLSIFVNLANSKWIEIKKNRGSLTSSIRAICWRIDSLAVKLGKKFNEFHGENYFQGEKSCRKVCIYYHVMKRRFKKNARCLFREIYSFSNIIPIEKNHYSLKNYYVRGVAIRFVLEYAIFTKTITIWNCVRKDEHG